MRKYKFPKLTPKEIDNVNRPIIKKETERLKKKKKGSRTKCSTIDKKMQIHSFYGSNIILISEKTSSK